MKQSGRQHRGGTSAGASTPFIISGWELLRWPEFETRWNELVKEVERLKQNDPIGYKQAEVTRFLAAVVKIVRDDVPSEVGS